MKNNFFIIKLILLLFFTTSVFAQNLEIKSSEVRLDKKESKIILKGNIEAVDEKKLIKSE